MKTSKRILEKILVISAYKAVAVKQARSRSRGSTTSSCKNGITMDLKGMSNVGVKWIPMAYDRVQQPTHANTQNV